MRQDFYTWLTAELDKRGWSKRDLANAHKDLPEGTVYAVLSPGHVRHVSASFCVFVAKALNVPTVDVLKIAEFPIVHEPPPELSPDIAESLRILSALTDDEREVVVRMLRGLAE